MTRLTEDHIFCEIADYDKLKEIVKISKKHNRSTAYGLQVKCRFYYTKFPSIRTIISDKQEEAAQIQLYFASKVTTTVKEVLGSQNWSTDITLE